MFSRLATFMILLVLMAALLGCPDQGGGDGGGKSSGTFAAPITSYLDNNAYGVVLEDFEPVQSVESDFNGDGYLDRAENDGEDIPIYLGGEDGTQSAYATYYSGGGVDISSGDYNRDGNMDLASLRPGGGGGLSGDVVVLFGQGNGNFLGAVSVGAVGERPKVLTSADFDGDGDDDLAVVTLGQDNAFLEVLLSNGNNTFAMRVRYIMEERLPIGIMNGDLNGDGIVDIAVLQTGDLVAIFLGNP